MKAVIVDDERLARVELRRLLAAHPNVEVVGEARDGPEAAVLVNRLAPDLVFLDVQMPGMTGFEVLEQLDDVPDVIFTTAYDEFAVRAFEVNALDYLLKPVTPDRLTAALARLRPAGRGGTLDQVFVRDGDRCWIVRVQEIALLESEGNYTRIHFRSDHPLIRRSLNSLEERLDTAVFFRANRAQIVNLKWIEATALGLAETLVLTLRGGLTVELSRRRSEQLRQRLGL